MDKYIKLKVVGQGAFGKALLVQDKETHDKYVLKTIEVAQLSKKEKDAAMKEVSVLSSLNHPNIIRYKESFTHKGKLCIVAEYADGGDLSDKISKQNGNHFPEETILDWFVQICLAMKHVHDRKILHRDLKTQNIFLTKSGMIKLGDFGIARVLDSTMEQAHTCIGTPYYLSPEICQEKAYDFKSDVWSLGCVLYELATLKHAFNANNIGGLVLKILRGIYPPLSSRYSIDLRNLVSAMLQRNPRKRPNIARILRMPVVKRRIENLLSATVMQSEFNHTVLHAGQYPKNEAGIPIAPGPNVSVVGESITASEKSAGNLDSDQDRAKASRAAAAERARLQAMERAADRAKRREEAEAAERARRVAEEEKLKQARARRAEEERLRRQKRREELLKQKKLREKRRKAEKEAREQAALGYQAQIDEIAGDNGATDELQELTSLRDENNARLSKINAKMAKKRKGSASGSAAPSKPGRKSSVSRGSVSGRRSSTAQAREARQSHQAEAARKVHQQRSVSEAKKEAHRAATEAKHAAGKAAFEARQRQKEEKKALEAAAQEERERKKSEWEAKRADKLREKERQEAEHRARVRKMKEGASSARPSVKEFIKEKKAAAKTPSSGRKSSVTAGSGAGGGGGEDSDAAAERQKRREEERERMRLEIKARRKGLKKGSMNSTDTHAQGGSAFIIDLSDNAKSEAAKDKKKKKKKNAPSAVKKPQAFEVPAGLNDVAPDSPTFIVHSNNDDDGDDDGDDSEVSDLTVSSVGSLDDLDASDSDSDSDDDIDNDIDDEVGDRDSATRRLGFSLDLPSTGELEEGIELPSHRTVAEEAAIASQEYDQMMDDLRDVLVGNDEVPEDEDYSDDFEDDTTPANNANVSEVSAKVEPLVKGELKLKGRTLLMPDKNDPESAYYRIESLKMYCEEELGPEEFMRAYCLLKIVREDDDDDGVMDELVEVLGTQETAAKFVPIIYQIIISEDAMRA